jgi:ATP-dependent Clp protease ATP-binding subunit ClpC
VTATLETEADERDHADGIREPDDVRRERRRRAQENRRPVRPRRPSRADTTKDLAKRLFDTGPRPALVTPSKLPLPPSVRRASETGEFVAITKDKKSLKRQHLVLKEREFPLLSKLGRNLTLRAFDGELDEVVGRSEEIDKLVDILNKRRSNNPVLVGEAGVGKTSVVEGLAQRLVGAFGHEPPPGLAGRIIIELEATKVVSGTGLRGSFSERIQKIKAEVARARGQVVLFLDELHHWMGMGGGDGAADGAGELKTALARGEFPCIGATTFDEYHRFVENDPAFARRFQKVRVEEPSVDDAVRILTRVKTTYQNHHKVEFDDDAIEAAVRLSHRYLPDRRLPDKAISVLDLAGSRARRTSTKLVDRALVATVLAEQAGVSVDKLLLSDRQRFVGLGDRLAEHIIGHSDVVETVAHALRRNYAGFVSGRPIGTFLFLGPTGVGKTEFAKAIARVLFEDEGAMVRMDMSEFMEAHSVSRLIGSPPGYVGHESGGQLTESIRRKPYQLVLFDEIEKAHPEVLNILIQLLDEGRLTDSRGRTVDFSNTVVVMTSNLGAEAAIGTKRTRRVGFGAASSENSAAMETTEAVREEAKGHFRPELWNRIQERLVFLPLQETEVAEIAGMQLRDSSKRLATERRISFSWSGDVIQHLIENGGFDPEMGARPMRRTIERLVESAIADLILTGEAQAGAHIDVEVEDGRITAAVR